MKKMVNPKIDEYYESGLIQSSKLTSMRLWGLYCLSLTMPILAGCGTDFSQILLQTGSAVGQTALDILLTDLVNQIADVLDPTTNPPPADGDTEDHDDHTPVDGTNFDDLSGDSAAGEPVYTSNNCGSCHCVDASGGCALSAPSLIGESAISLDIHLRGAGDHPVKVDLTDQEIVDLEAYLASL